MTGAPDLASVRAMLLDALNAQRDNMCRLVLIEPDDDPDSLDFPYVSIKGEIHIDKLAATVSEWFDQWYGERFYMEFDQSHPDYRESEDGSGTYFFANAGKWDQPRAKRALAELSEPSAPNRGDDQ
jgi:hypothetical protein